MAKKLARVEQAQKELADRVKAVQGRLKFKANMMKSINKEAMAQHKVEEENEKRAEHIAMKQKRLMHQGKKLARIHSPDHKQQKKQGDVPSAIKSRKPVQSDVPVPPAGTNIAFQGASQGGDTYFHQHQSAKNVSPSVSQKQ